MIANKEYKIGLNKVKHRTELSFDWGSGFSLKLGLIAGDKMVYQKLELNFKMSIR